MRVNHASGIPIDKMTPELLHQRKAERLGQLGGALGLDPQFVSEVQMRGMDAVRDRADLIDASGAHGRLLLMTQQFGMFLQERMEGGDVPVKLGVLLEAAEMISQAHGINPDLGVQILGTVLEVYQMTAKRLAASTYEGSDNATAERRTDNPGR